jgi:hypothetical protein
VCSHSLAQARRTGTAHRHGALGTRTRLLNLYCTLRGGASSSAAARPCTARRGTHRAHRTNVAAMAMCVCRRSDRAPWLMAVCVNDDDYLQVCTWAAHGACLPTHPRCSLLTAHTWKLSRQPQRDLTLGLLKTNSALSVSSFST